VAGGVRVEPQRTCAGCRTEGAQRELLRLGRTSEGELVLGRGPGRGTYVHRDPACIDRALRAPVLARALRAGVSPDEVGRLRERIEGELGST